MLANRTLSSRELISYKNFVFWCFSGVFTAAIVYFFARYSLLSTIITSTGLNPNIWFFSILMYTAIIFVFLLDR